MLVAEHFPARDCIATQAIVSLSGRERLRSRERDRGLRCNEVDPETRPRRSIGLACASDQRTHQAMGAVMSDKDAVRSAAIWQRGARLIVLTLLGAVLFGAGASARSPKPVRVARCGYANATYGRSALYPWHMSCAAARDIVRASDSPDAHVIYFGPGWMAAPCASTAVTGSVLAKWATTTAAIPIGRGRSTGSRATRGHSPRTWST